MYFLVPAFHCRRHRSLDRWGQCDGPWRIKVNNQAFGSPIFTYLCDKAMQKESVKQSPRKSAGYEPGFGYGGIKNVVDIDRQYL